jgi:hypothetical protein
LSYREIGEALGVAHTTAEDWCVAKATNVGNATAPESRQHFDLWNFAKADGDSSYFGRMPPQVVADGWPKSANLRNPATRPTLGSTSTCGLSRRQTKEARQAEKDALKAKAWGLWLDCKSYREIASKLDGPDEDTVGRWVSAKAKEFGNADAPESRQHFDVWNFAKADGESSYFGKMPPQVVENLLWLYTDVGDVRRDARSSNFVDVDKNRRCLKPISSWQPCRRTGPSPRSRPRIYPPTSHRREPSRLPGDDPATPAPGAVDGREGLRPHPQRQNPKRPLAGFPCRFLTRYSALPEPARKRHGQRRGFREERLGLASTCRPTPAAQTPRREVTTGGSPETFLSPSLLRRFRQPRGRPAPAGRQGPAASRADGKSPR